MKTMIASNCCGVEGEDGDGQDWQEMNVCPECKEPCEWEEVEI